MFGRVIGVEHTPGNPSVFNKLLKDFFNFDYSAPNGVLKTTPVLYPQFAKIHSDNINKYRQNTKIYIKIKKYLYPS